LEFRLPAVRHRVNAEPARELGHEKALERISKIIFVVGADVRRLKFPEPTSKTKHANGFLNRRNQEGAEETEVDPPPLSSVLSVLH